jgi:hypothetical protein
MCIDQQPAWLLADPAGRTSPIIRDRGLFTAVRFNSAKHGCGAQVQGLQERTPLPGRRADNQWGRRLSPKPGMDRFGRNPQADSAGFVAQARLLS